MEQVASCTNMRVDGLRWTCCAGCGLELEAGYGGRDPPNQPDHSSTLACDWCQNAKVFSPDPEDYRIIVREWDRVETEAVLEKCARNTGELGSSRMLCSQSLGMLPSEKGASHLSYEQNLDSAMIEHTECRARDRCCSSQDQLKPCLCDHIRTSSVKSRRKSPKCHLRFSPLCCYPYALIVTLAIVGVIAPGCTADWIEAPTDESVEEGGNVTLPCLAENADQRSFIWGRYLNGSTESQVLFSDCVAWDASLVPGNHHCVQVSDGCNLVIAGATREDDRDYVCSVSGIQTPVQMNSLKERVTITVLGEQ